MMTYHILILQELVTIWLQCINLFIPIMSTIYSEVPEEELPQSPSPF